RPGPTAAWRSLPAVLLPQDGRDRPEQELQVVSDGDPAEVAEVHTDPLTERDPRPSLNLPDAGQARHDVQPLVVPGLTGCRFGARQRPGSDETHLSPQHVPQLRQFIN